MTEIEQQLRAAMRKAVDAEDAMPGALIAAVHRRHRRRNRLLACVAALIIVAVAVPAVLVSRSLLASPAPAAPRPAPARHLPMRLTGLPLPPGTNLQLLVPAPAGWAAWYSTATGTTTPIAGFQPDPGAGDPKFGRVQGGFVVTGHRMHPFCARYDCAGPAYDYYFVADGSHVATKIGAGLVNWGVVASGQAGAVWLTSYPHFSDNMATTPANAQLVSTTGQALGPPYRLPAGYLPAAGVGRYLLLRFAFGKQPSGPPIYLLWDPATHQVVRRIVDAFAAGPDQIAWTQGCLGCQLQILNVATGRNLSTSTPAGLQTVWGYNATFSDNGQLLRFTTPTGATARCCRTWGAVDIISTSSGQRLAVIPGLSRSRWVTVQWQAGGPMLVVADAPAYGTGPQAQVGFWQAGDSHLRIATLTNAPDNGRLVQFLQFLQSAAPWAEG
jgi:hypothetical protein